MAYQYNPSSAPAILPGSPSTATSKNLADNMDVDMMDEDAPIAPAPTNQEESATTETVAGVPEAYFMDLDDIGKITPEKVHARGVDDMTTEQVAAWANAATASAGIELKKVEWIDDSSCNLIYEDKELAGTALGLLTGCEPTKEQVEDRLLLRSAKGAESHPMARLQVRIAKDTDRKQKGARERSRFYLFNPEYDRGEAAERRRRGGDLGNRRRRPRDDLENGDYDKRRFDDREHRRRQDDAGDFDAGMYDDEPSAGRRERRPPRRSRDRSFSPGRPRRDEYRSRRTRSRSPPRKREATELFPNKVQRNNLKHGLLATSDVDYAIEEPKPTPIMDDSAFASTPSTSAPSRSGGGFSILGAGKQNSFSQEHAQAGKSLAERIAFKPKSLAERISIPEEKADLFPDKLRAAEKSHSGKLNIDLDNDLESGGGRRNGRRNRRRAHEMFGED